MAHLLNTLQVTNFQVHSRAETHEVLPSLAVCVCVCVCVDVWENVSVPCD